MHDADVMSLVIRGIGIALLQFLWQGAAIGAMTALLLRGFRHATASTRYLVACSGLAAMCVVPVLTAASDMRATAPTRAIVIDTTSPVMPEPQTAASAAVPQTPVTSSIFSRTWIDARLPFVVSVWLGGVIVLALHLLRGWRTVGRIRNSSSPLTDARWLDLLQQIAERLGVTVRVRLLTSSALDVPSVIGWLRPAIVIPVSALAGLSPAHLEAILAHELAHVRRGDYLVNILQRVVETLLFYHPAVWWVSSRIRIERENCCDDLVVSRCADRVAYADALTSLEELRAATPSLAMGARGGDLLQRVRRLVEPGHDPESKWSGGVVMSAVLIVLLLSVGAHLNGTTPDAAPASQQPTDPKPVVVVPEVLPTITIDRTVVPAVVNVRPIRPKVSPAQGVPMVSQRATLSGVIKSPGGSVMPGVTVTLTSTVMTGSRVIVTDAQGYYLLNDLAAGTYEVNVTRPGFRTVTDQVRLSANQNAAFNATLEVGKVTETVIIGRGTRTLLTESEKPFDATGVLRVGGSIKEPKIIKRVEPIYPEVALAAKVQGYVIIEAIIAKDGSVRAAHVIKPSPLLDDAALAAVRQWVYSPPLVDGEPVEVVMSVTVIFSLKVADGAR
jgi:TonB family protein